MFSLHIRPAASLGQSAAMHGARFGISGPERCSVLHTDELQWSRGGATTSTPANLVPCGAAAAPIACLLGSDRLSIELFYKACAGSGNCEPCFAQRASTAMLSRTDDS